MPELRHDPIQGRWVIIAAERGRRPNAFISNREPPPPEFCPFCEGNEASTPPEIFAVRRNGSRPNSPGWQVRVVPNKYPALVSDGEIERNGLGVHDRMSGIGAHEVIIENPIHEVDLADAPLEQVDLVIRCYIERLTSLCRDLRFNYTLIFKNQGLNAGATLSHPHTQLIATPVLPLTLAEELSRAAEHYKKENRCLFCRIIDQEAEAGERLVEAGKEFVAITPFASRFPYEILLAPRDHHHSFAEIPDSMIRPLSSSLKSVLSRIKSCLDNPSYNFLIHTVPNLEAAVQATDPAALELSYHWHMEIMPRITGIAGFEWGTGFYINPILPEEAARRLRETES